MPASYRRPDATNLPAMQRDHARWLPLSAAALTDRRAVDTAEELAGTLRRKAAASARFPLKRDQTPERLQAERELEELEETIDALEATLRERPWTEA
ncbi:hypothetical protein BH24CHL6_BH24CHL6_10070 [soil metagenome]